MVVNSWASWYIIWWKNKFKVEQLDHLMAHLQSSFLSFRAHFWGWRTIKKTIILLNKCFFSIWRLASKQILQSFCSKYIFLFPISQTPNHYFSSGFQLYSASEFACRCTLFKSHRRYCCLFPWWNVFYIVRFPKWPQNAYSPQKLNSVVLEKMSFSTPSPQTLYTVFSVPSGVHYCRVQQILEFGILNTDFKAVSLSNHLWKQSIFIHRISCKN